MKRAHQTGVALQLTTPMAEYRERLRKEHEMLGTAKANEPYTLLKDLVNEDDRQRIREFFHSKKEQHMAAHIGRLPLRTNSQ